jgi:hypothetical protein
MDQRCERKSNDDKSSGTARSVSGQSISHQPHNRFQLPPKLGELDIGQIASTTVLINSALFLPKLDEFHSAMPPGHTTAA